MLFGASTFIWVSPFSTDNIDLLTKVKNMGYDIIEIAVEDTRIIDWKLIKDTARDLDLKITISGAFGPERDISSTDPAFREIGKQYIIDCIRIAEQMDSPVFGGPVYSAVGKTRIVSEEQKKQERAWCVDILKEVSQVAGDCGVTLGLEPLNRFETDMVNTVDQALSILDEVGSPHLKIVLDTFHSNIEEKDIPATVRKIGKDLLCHVQGNESDRGTPGTGHLEWQGIQEALTDIGYDGAVVIETFGQPSKELARAACIWRPLANSADELATEGLAFYKKLFVPTHSTVNA
ncbi:sugar phosphate isomerase/epimerase family protein [Dyadobacter fermentans]|uniref:Xylose isomerase domain protein TIM barrel n=1 Tax=Dyadobacter fermentans (strain ATCC 700827 / DSM 18053 / CIP 107007 / KCTC 52180 / NS114) TaxID=471854 RepID=C6W4S8_DYAFD|nr:sugar phosphate isomerase/epimerase family protein [Dyadobacter fermentans]ACT95902.1 Xylose isomerase domain protein TIM barrel [Dyadobacter fermentans DSM 18053]